MNIVVATTSTPHYDLTVVSDSEAGANVALLKRWAAHAESSFANPSLMAHLIERGDVNYHHVKLGEVIFE